MPRASCRSASGTTGCPAPTTPPTKLIKEWAEKEKVEVQIDFITSQGNKLLLTGAAEAQAKSGHDILALADLAAVALRRAARAGQRPHGAELIKQNGAVNATVEYLGKSTASGSPCRRRSAARSRVRARASTS